MHYGLRANGPSIMVFFGLRFLFFGYGCGLGLFTSFGLQVLNPKFIKDMGFECYFLD